MTKNKATEIVFKRLVSDCTYTDELQQLLRGCPTLESKAAAIERYCDTNWNRSLEEELQVQVVPKLMQGASWTEIATRLDEAMYVERVKYSIN